MNYYSQNHYRLISNGGPDTQKEVQQRIKHEAVCHRVSAEMAAKYPKITKENFLEADLFRIELFDKYMKEAGF